MEQENHPKQFKDMPTVHAPVCTGMIPYLTSNHVAGASETVSVQHEALQGMHACCNGIQEMACIHSGNWLIINAHGSNEQERNKYTVKLASLVLYFSGIKMLELYVITHQSRIIQMIHNHIT